MITIITFIKGLIFTIVPKLCINTLTKKKLIKNAAIIASELTSLEEKSNFFTKLFDIGGTKRRHSELLNELDKINKQLSDIKEKEELQKMVLSKIGLNILAFLPVFVVWTIFRNTLVMIIVSSIYVLIHIILTFKKSK